MKYKITNIHEVEAESPEEAVMKFNNRGVHDEYLRDIKYLVMDQVEEIKE